MGKPALSQINFHCPGTTLLITEYSAPPYVMRAKHSNDFAPFSI